MQQLVMNFIANDLEEFAETQLTDETLSYVSPEAMRVRIEVLRAEMRLIASSLRAAVEGPSSLSKKKVDRA